MVATAYLVLGGYTFSGFGVPERINGGGKHQLVVHKFLGGARVIDAMGADDDPISFQGRFRSADGTDPMTDVQLMDAMRRAGKPVTLTYWNQNIQVVVRSFTWSFERFYEVPYKIECEVLSNASAKAAEQTQTAASAASADMDVAQSMWPASSSSTAASSSTQSVGASAASDMTTAQNMWPADSTAATASVANASTTLSQQGPIGLSTPGGLAAVQSAVFSAQASLSTLAVSADIPSLSIGAVLSGNGISASGAITVGSPVLGLSAAVNLNAYAGLMTAGATAQVTLPFLNRISINLATPGVSVSV